jgi:hypothetical protein
MADEKPKEKESSVEVKTPLGVLTEIAVIFLIFMILSSFFNNLISTFEINNLFKNGWKGFTISGLALSNTRPLSSVSNPINARVLTSNKKTIVYDSAGGKKIDERNVGDYGRVIRGPVTSDGEKYYFVDFEKGKDGWVKENDLAYLEPTTRGLKSDDPLGSKVLSNGKISVFDIPGGQVEGTQRSDSKGKITKGPIEKDGTLYYYVDFEDGVDGYVKKDDLLFYNDGSRYLGSQDGVGSEVVSASSDTGIYDENGNIVDKQSNGVKGKITKGPLNINGQKYWFVEYEDGKSGYVREDDLKVLVKRDKLFLEKVFAFIGYIYFGLKILLLLIGLIAIIWLISLNKKLAKIRNNNKDKLSPVFEHKEQVLVNPKWQRVVSNIDSVNSADWKIAILEADIMLDELLDTMQVHGDTISDKLKSIEKSDFLTIDLAWEAHKVRNRIAHDGSDFVLTQREAKRVISLYEEVFFHEREKEWHLAVRHYTLFIRKWKWGREHLYYDGPHCFIYLGWICFYYSPNNCKRCEVVGT